MSAEVRSPSEAAARVSDGDRVMVGGFGLVGSPLTLIDALLESGVRELTVMSNNVGQPGEGLGQLLGAGRISRAVGSYFTSNPDVITAHEAGELDVELMPQGTFAEAIRAGGAGVGGFYTPTGVGTMLAEGREQRTIGERDYLFYEGLRADVALVRAARADGLGNLAYSRTAQNFNPDMASAAELVIAEVDEIVEPGELPPAEVETPHLYVDVLVRSEAEDR